MYLLPKVILSNLQMSLAELKIGKYAVGSGRNDAAGSNPAGAVSIKLTEMAV